jgi:RNA polymerase sigma factor (sigma-70 family)
MSPQSSSTGRLLDPPSWRLLRRARHGDPSALGQLLTRYLPELARWAHGRLPRWARTIADTADLIQDAVLHTIGRLDTFELRGRRALAAYLREAVRNRIRDEHRRLARRGVPGVSVDTLADPAPSPLDRAMTDDLQDQYRAALDRLTPSDRELIVAHLELDYTHAQLGCMTGRTANAARMALHRAIRRLADEMRHA